MLLAVVSDREQRDSFGPVPAASCKSELIYFSRFPISGSRTFKPDSFKSHLISTHCVSGIAPDLADPAALRGSQYSPRDNYYVNTFD